MVNRKSVRSKGRIDLLEKRLGIIDKCRKQLASAPKIGCNLRSAVSRWILISVNRWQRFFVLALHSSLQNEAM